LGVKRGHIRYQSTPAGGVMVLVWVAVPQDELRPLMADMVHGPQSEHGCYLATPVIPVLHGVDPAAA
jgi:hypothetical protein